MSDGPVEVTMVMNMNGEFADVFMPRPPVGTQPVVPEVPEPMSSEGFTGLVIDARGLGTRPAMSPKI